MYIVHTRKEVEQLMMCATWRKNKLSELVFCLRCRHYHRIRGLRASFACAVARCLGDILDDPVGVELEMKRLE